jgi:hypothetical protein
MTGLVSMSDEVRFIDHRGKVVMQQISKFLFLGCMILCKVVHSMEFEYTSRFSGQSSLTGTANQITMSGPIVSGDTKRFLEFIQQNPKDSWFGLKRIRLDSPGGDVLEAMKLANVLTDLYPSIWVSQGKKCASSCLLLWLAGASRGFDSAGSVGMHRPRFSKEYEKSLSLKEYQKRYQLMSDNFKTFVRRQGLPESLYERLVATSSDNVYWLTEDDWQLVGTWPPYYAEKLLSTCGPIPNGSVAEHNKCEAGLTVREKAEAFDRIVGDRKDAWWAAARARFLGQN